MATSGTPLSFGEVVRALAPMAGLMAVNGLMSQAQQGSQIIAPSIAGELVQLVGANSCFLFDSFSFFFSAALVVTLTIDRQAGRSEASAVLDSMRQGFRFIFTHSTISFVVLSMTAAVFWMRWFVPPVSGCFRQAPGPAPPASL